MTSGYFPETQDATAAAATPLSMPAKNPYPLRRHPCHSSTFGAV